MPTLELESPEASSATANASAAPPPISRSKPACAPSIVSIPVLPVSWNSDAATTSMVRLITPARPIAITTSTRWKRSSERRSPSSRGAIRALHERAVQVDDVRHDRRAEDADGEHDAVGAVEAGHEAGEQRARVDVDLGEVVEEAEADDPEEARDGQLEAPVAALLQREDAERDDRGDQPRRERRHAEQQVERDRRADELGEVGRDRDDLRLRPTGPRSARRGRCARHSSGRFLPVAMPTLADRYCTSIAIRFAATITHTSRKPYFAPPAMFVAKLPGSM